MAKTIQRLSNINALRRFDVRTGRQVSLSDVSMSNGWSADNATLEITASNFYVSHYYNMEINPIDEGPVTLTLSVDDLFNQYDDGATFVFTGVMNAPTTSIQVTAAFYNSYLYVAEGKTRSIQAGTWFAFRSNTVKMTPYPDGTGNTSYMVSLTITGHGGNQIKMSTPNVVNDNVWALNPVVSNLKTRIPDFYIDYDGLETDPQYPFLRFIDVYTDTIADSMQIYSDWFRHDAEEIQTGLTKNTPITRSRLTDYKYARSEYFPWLFQFSGVTQVKELVVGGDVVIPASNTDYRNAQLSPAIYGRGAGTQSAIKTAAQFVLTGTKTVVISQMVGGDPWVMKLTTLTSETPSSEVVLAAVEEARPLGFTITHEAVADFNFILGDPIYGRLGSGHL